VDRPVKLSDGYVHVPARAVCGHFIGHIICAGLRIDKPEGEDPIIRVFDSDISRLSRDDLVHEETLDLPHGLEVPRCDVGILDFNGDRQVFTARILNHSHLHVVVLALSEVKPLGHGPPIDSQVASVAYDKRRAVE